jgi:hypothetical protein
MSPQRAWQRATPRAPKPERITYRMTVKLKRIRQYGGLDHGKRAVRQVEPPADA